MSTFGRRIAPALLAAALAAGCGDDEPVERAPDPLREGSDLAAKPPPGWRVVGNAQAGFTLSVPRTWTARRKGRATLILSDDRLVSVTGAADRARDGRALSAARYARETLSSLPGFKGRLAEETRRIPGTPYRTARAEARGRVRASRVPQRITAAVYQRPGRVTYELLVFRNARVKPRFNEPVVDRMLRSFRAQAPDITP